MFARKDLDALFAKAVENNEMFDFLTGQNGYEIRLDVAYMPTDTISDTIKIEDFLSRNPDFDTKKLVDVFLRMSQEPEWAWLIVYYSVYFEKRGMNFLPLHDLYDNVKNNKTSLSKNNGWLCFNFKGVYDNLWDIIVFDNKRFIEDGYKLPKLE